MSADVKELIKELEISSPGFIRPEDLYTQSELQDRLGVGRHTMEKLKRAGLEFIEIGRRNYFLGKDVINCFLKANERQNQPAMAVVGE